MQVVFDVVEILAIFLLAVEAIKLENLSVLVNRLLAPTLGKINPKIEFIEDDNEYVGFFDRYWFEFVLISFYIVGLLISWFVFLKFNFHVFEWLSNTSGFTWVWVVPCMLFVPILVGFLPYQGVVLVFELSIKSLSWIEKHTKTGVVGILGFFLYLLQFVGRILLSS